MDIPREIAIPGLFKAIFGVEPMASLFAFFLQGPFDISFRAAVDVYLQALLIILLVKSRLISSFLAPPFYPCDIGCHLMHRP